MRLRGSESTLSPADRRRQVASVFAATSNVRQRQTALLVPSRQARSGDRKKDGRGQAMAPGPTLIATRLPPAVYRGRVVLGVRQGGRRFVTPASARNRDTEAKRSSPSASRLSTPSLRVALAWNWARSPVRSKPAQGHPSQDVQNYDSTNEQREGTCPSAIRATARPGAALAPAVAPERGRHGGADRE